MRIFRTCLKLSIKNDQNFEQLNYEHRSFPDSRTQYPTTSTKYNEDRYMMNRTTKESEISNYFTDWLVQWSSILIVCRKVGSVYCLRGSKTNLFGLPFVWDSVRQFNCVSDRYSYQSFSRDEIDLKWSSQE